MNNNLKCKTIMLQGTSSHVGKSLLCTALCRIFKQDGLKVAPFKAQNMALNSFVTIEGKEIGRAQGVQAEAAGVRADERMNPVLLKPKMDMVAQVVVMGKPYLDMSARDYRSKFLPEAEGLVRRCIDSLRQEFEVLVIEGAGSPAEVNLKDKDIVNMKAAELAHAPVLLVADIDRGGVFAALVGTLELLEEHERQRVAGFIINKFRGDIDLLRPGLEFLEKRTGIPVVGVVPYLHNHGIDQEDSVVLAENNTSMDKTLDIDIAVIKLPRISNFTDLDPLYCIPATGVRFVNPGEGIGSPDVVIIPGTKNTVHDLHLLWQTGTAQEINRLAEKGTQVVGLCGGFQMLGKMLYDNHGLEGVEKSAVAGLGFIDMDTTFKPGKTTRQIQCEIVGSIGFWQGIPRDNIIGYEIHSGQSRYEDGAVPIIINGDHIIGAASSEHNVWGTYLHGIFENTEFTLAWINALRTEKGLRLLNLDELKVISRDQIFDALAGQVRKYLDMEQIYQIIQDSLR